MLTTLLTLLGGALLVVIVALAMAGRFVRPMATASAYRNVAWSEGLEADTRGTSLRGTWQDRRLYVGPSGAGAATHAMLDLRVPLGLGLKVVPRTRRLPVRPRRRPRATWQTGDPDIDESLVISAWAPADRVAALFDDAVREALSTLVEAGWSPEIADHHLRVALRRPPSSEAALRRLLDRLARAADALEHARSTLPPDPDTAAWDASWAVLARRRGLAHDRTMPSLHGTLDGCGVRVLPVRIEDRLGVDVRVTPAAMVRRGLLVRAATADEADGRVIQDILVGELAFDDAFIVQGWDPSAVRDTLDAPARAAMVRLAAVGRVSLADDGLDLRDAEVAPDGLDAVLDDAVRVVGALGRPAAD